MVGAKELSKDLDKRDYFHCHSLKKSHRKLRKKNPVDPIAHPVIIKRRDEYNHAARNNLEILQDYTNNIYENEFFHICKEY